MLIFCSRSATRLFNNFPLLQVVKFRLRFPPPGRTIHSLRVLSSTTHVPRIHQRHFISISPIPLCVTSVDPDQFQDNNSSPRGSYDNFDNDIARRRCPSQSTSSIRRPQIITSTPVRPIHNHSAAVPTSSQLASHNLPVSYGQFRTRIIQQTRSQLGPNNPSLSSHHSELPAAVAAARVFHG